MERNGSAPNTICERQGEIPLFLEEPKDFAVTTHTTITMNEVISVNPSIVVPEIVLFALTGISAISKLLFSCGFVFVVIFPNAVQPLLPGDFDGGVHYVAHSTLYFSTTIVAVLNTMLMIQNRMKFNFFDKPQILRRYSVINAIGICLQIFIYCFYAYEYDNNETSKLIGEIMAFFLLMDMCLASWFLIIECTIHKKLNHFDFVLQQHLAAMDNEAISY